MKRARLFKIAVMSLFLLSAANEIPAKDTPPAAPETVALAKEGEARLPIVVAEGSDEKLFSLATELKGFLDRITGANFEVVTKPLAEAAAKSQGPAIVLGTRAQFPDLLSEPVKAEAFSWKESYRLVTQNGSLFLIGETELAVQDAVFDLLHTIGYRQFFPHPAWEIVPHLPDLTVAVDRTEEPGFATRYMFYANVTDKELIRIFGINKINSNYTQWRRKNRGQSPSVNSGHVWHRMAARHAQEFAAHPEWISGKQENPWTEPTNTDWKFRVENEDLRKVLRKDIRDTFDANPVLGTYSIDPTDGAGWPENSPIGTPSDQMVYLANDLVASLKDTYPDKKVAFYAYNHHSPPPTLKLEGNAIVNVATGFIRGGYTVPQLMREWKAKGAELGIRDYTNVFFGSWDLPGNQSYLGFSPEKAHDAIVEYYKDGARYWISESDAAWGAMGLGTYITFRTLWSPTNGPSTEELKNDFLTKSFGPVAETVRQFFEVIDPKNNPLLSSDLIGRMYDPLLAALKENQDPAVRVRLLQLLSYTRFSELMYQFRNAPAGPERIEAFRALGEWALRYRQDQMFDALGVFTRIGIYVNKRTGEENELTPTAEKLLARHEKFQPLPEDAFIKLATTRAKESLRMAFTPVVFSSELVRPDFSAKPAQEIYELTGRQTLLWLAEKPDSELQLTMRSFGKRPPGAAAIAVKITHVDDVLDAPCDAQEITPDGAWHTVTLRPAMPGLHKVEILDPTSYLEIKWPSGTPLVFPFTQVLHGMPRAKDVPYSGWISIPAKADRVAGYSEAPAGKILNDSGKVLHDFAKRKGPNYFDVKIKPSDESRVFKLEGMTGKIMLMTTPPYMARSPDELLVPKTE